MTETHQKRPFFSGSVSLGNVITAITGIVAITVFLLRLEGATDLAAADRESIRAEIHRVEQTSKDDDKRIEQLFSQRFSAVERRLDELRDILSDINRKLDARP